MHRKDAIEILVCNELAGLSKSERERKLLDWWSIDADDPEYAALPDDLKEKLAHDEEPFDARNPMYDPLLLISLRFSYIGVVNAYLEKRLAQFGQNAKVEGEVEALSPCDCCGYRAIEDAGWDICPVCFWENDGTADPDSVSGCNHLTLGEARANFLRIGAVEEAHVQHVLPDGKERYCHRDAEMALFKTDRRRRAPAPFGTDARPASLLTRRRDDLR
jgi:hypothetical protein